MNALAYAAHAVIKQSETLRELNNQKHLKERVIEVSATVARLASELSAAATVAEECASGGLTDARPTSQAARAGLRRVESLASLAESDPLSVIHSEELSIIRADAANATQELKAQARVIWREFCDRHIPVPQPGLIELIEAREGGPTAATSALERLDRTLAHLRILDPTENSGSVTILLKTLDERAGIWASFDLDHVPTEIREFLDLCAEGGAPLSQLTSQVSEWLSAERLLDRYVVVPGEDS